ncbi:MAG TPA: hypothetical protein VGA61_00145 [Anaerolineae bacterium]
MKTDSPPRLSVIDALSSGLDQARRRSWLILFPFLLDLALWLAPRLSPAPLVQRFMQAWDLLVQNAYTPDQLLAIEPMMRQLHEHADLLSGQANLFDGIAGGWLGAPSLLATGQITRLSFVSDLVLGQVSLAGFPQRALPLEIHTFGGLLLATIGLWLIGQAILALYLRLAGKFTQPADYEGPKRSFLGLMVRLAVFSIVIAIAVGILESLLSLALALVNLSGNSPLSILALMFAGVVLWLTLWFLLALFFANEGMVLEGRPVLRSMLQSIRLVNGHLGSALGLIGVINLLMYGFRVIWGLIAVTPAGAVAAILGNAYLSTSMLLAAFAFFGSLRKATVTAQAKAVN